MNRWDERLGAGILTLLAAVTVVALCLSEQRPAEVAGLAGCRPRAVSVADAQLHPPPDGPTPVLAAEHFLDAPRRDDITITEDPEHRRTESAEVVVASGDGPTLARLFLRSVGDGFVVDSHVSCPGAITAAG